MVTATNVIVAGDRDLSLRLRTTERFSTVFDVASATELRDLSRSGEVSSPAAFLFARGFNEDLSGSGVPVLANGLAANGFTVIVHGFYAERGDTFVPEVVVTSRGMTMTDLLAMLDSVRPGPTSAASAVFDRPADDPAAGPQPDIGEPSSQPGAARTSADDSSSLIPGYSELSIVHRGACSVTYRAVHEMTGTTVAIRVRLDGSETPAEELAALERASRSDHVLTVLESGRATTGQLYTASVFCARGAHAPDPLPIEDAVGTAISMGKGLQALHDEGLVHGDVHPGRFLRGVARPLLTGAATARGLGTHSEPGFLEPVDPARVDGGFASPEALGRRPQTPRSDVYGLGATLWSLLAGRAPFAVDGERASGEVAPGVPRDDVPDWLRSVLEKAMASDPADRYPTAQAFTDALEENLHTVLSPPPYEQGPPGQTWQEPELDADPYIFFPEQQTPSPEQHVPSTEQHAPSLIQLAPLPEQHAPAGRFRRRGLVMVASVAFMLVVTALGAIALVADSGTGKQRSQAGHPPAPVTGSSTPTPVSTPTSTPQTTPASPSTPTSKPTSSPTAVRPAKKYTPTQVRIVDNRVSIAISWTDGSEGKAAYYVVGGPPGHTPSTLASAPPGSTKAEIVALNPSVEYCLTVVAVVNVDQVAYTKPVCTHRGKRNS